MSETPFSFGTHASSPGLPGRSGNASSNVGLAGSALLPAITAELRSEFYPLLSTLARSGSGISAAYIMELFFTLVRFDAILHSDERHLFVSTAQQLITTQLQQLQTVHHKAKLLEENLTFVEELLERCAALECLSGSHEEAVDEADDNAGDAAGTTAPDIGTGADEDAGGEAGNNGSSSSNRNSAMANSQDVRGSDFSLRQQQQQQRRATPSRSAHVIPRALNPNSFSNTMHSTASSDPHRRQYFSFDEDLNDMVDRTGETQAVQTPSSQQQQQQRRKRDAEEKATNAKSSAGVDTNALTVSPPTTALRQRHLQRPPPLPLNLVADGASAGPTSAALAASTVGGPRAPSRSRLRAGATADQLGERLTSDVTLGAASNEDDEADVQDGMATAALDDGTAGSISAHVTPAIFTGVQHALQAHFRQNVKRTLTGTSWTAPASLAEMVPQQVSRAPHSGGAGGGDGERSTSPGQAEGVVSDSDRGAAVAVPPLQQYQAALTRHAFSTSQLSSKASNNNNSSFYAGLLGAASVHQLNLLPMDSGGPLAVSSLADPCASVYSSTNLDPVDTARVWDRMFWGFLDGRTATADLAVLLTLLNDGNAALAALQASEMNNKHASCESTTTTTTHAAGSAHTGKGGNAVAKPGGPAISGSSRLGGLSSDTIARSPPSTALPTPDCGALPLMEALKRTGSYSELMPVPAVSNMSIASITAAAVAAGAADEEERNRPVSCTIDGPSFFPSGSAVVNVRVSGGGGGINNLSNLDSAAVRPRQWINLDDYAKAEEARLHRDFWAHIPAILVTLSEGMMYGDSHRKASAQASREGKNGSGGGDACSRSGGIGVARQRRRRKHSASAVEVDAGGEVADAVGNAESLYDPAALRDSVNGEEDDTRDSAVLAEYPSSAAARSSRSRRNTSDTGGNTQDGGDDDGDKESGVDESEDDEDEPNLFVPLHLPSAEALQLLPTFSPLLRNYAGAMGKLLQAAPEYARSTQAQHARALASAVAQLQQLQAGTPNANDACATSGFTSENEAGTASVIASTTTASVAPESAGAMHGLARAATHRSSITDMQELNETAHYHTNGVDRRAPQPAGPRGGTGTKPAQPTSLPPTAGTAPMESLDLGLLGDGSRTEVRPVDVVMYALVTAVYVQCAMPMEHYRRLQHSGGLNAASNTGTNGRNTAVPPASTADGKASPSMSGRSPAGSTSPQPGFGWPNGSAAPSAGMSFAGDGAGAADSVVEDERTLNMSLANGSLSYVANTAAGSGGSPGWWNASAGGLGGRSGLPSNASFGLTPYVLRPAPLHPSNALGGSKYDNASFAQQQQMPNFSFDLSTSPTEAALSFLRDAHEERANGPRSEVGKKSDGQGAAVAAGAMHASLHTMQFPTQEVLGCANALSWVSLPSIMKAELQNLRGKLLATRNAVVSMEEQVRGELALLLFRVLSMVLDWLMPAVYVAEPRIWLFYRKWCCDLYRVLCTDLTLLDKFRTLLNQSGVAVIAASPSGDKETRPARSKRTTKVAPAMSATATPTYKPLRNDGNLRTPPRPTPQPGTPELSTVATLRRGSSARGDGATPADDRFGRVVAVSPFPSEASFRGGGDGNAAATEGEERSHDDEEEEEEEKPDLFSYILPGSSLVVSVSRATQPGQPGVVKLLAHEEADRRGEASTNVASLCAAKALLSDEGKVIPLPKPFLITRLVAATLRGIDADIAESLLWVVGGATEEHFDTITSGQRRASLADPDGIAHHSPKLRQQRQQQQQQQRSDEAEGSNHGSAVDNVHSTAQWKSQRPRHSSRTSSGHQLRTPHSTNSINANSSRRKATGQQREAAVHAGMGSPRFGNDDDDSDDDDDDSDDAQSMERRFDGSLWYGEDGRTRRRAARQPPAPAQSPVMSGPAFSGGTGGMPTAASASLFPIMAPHTPFNPNMSMNASPLMQYSSLPTQQPSQSAAAPEGPMLVHHHRFRYPTVTGFADVAQLYLSTLEDAELLLSPHDPIYASLVLSTADLHLHDLHDRDTAATLVSAYLADVGEEQIQGPVWAVLPTAVTSLDGAGGTGVSANSLAEAAGPLGHAAASSSAGHPTPGRGFSVTRVRQGNTGAGTGLTLASSTASSSPPHSPTPTPALQQPYVPMVIASWNDEQEKDEFLATLRVLKQIQAFLTPL